jgi:hypothetical protein
VQAAIAILDLVQMFDQQIAATRRVAEQGEHLLSRSRLNAPTLWRGAYPPAFLH